MSVGKINDAGAPVTHQITKDDYEKLAEFRHALRRFLAFSEKCAREVGLTAPQHQALLAIKGYPNKDCVTIRELAERLCIKHHSAVGLVDRMVAGGWVERQTGSDDRREVNIRLASEGERLLEALSEAHFAELQRFGPQLQKLIRQLSGEH